MRWSTETSSTETASIAVERPRDLLVATLTEYEAGLPVEVAFPPLTVTSLAEYFARLGWRQFHVAETEKYAHVTYFFNGGIEAPFANEERLLVPSPKVATYDLQPHMSAAGVTDGLVEAINSDQYDFIVANFANADMVGHIRRVAGHGRGARVRRRLPGAPGRGHAGRCDCCASRPITAMPTSCATPPANR